MTSTAVTLTDCGRALQEIEKELERLRREKTDLDRKIEALRTQGFLLSKLAKLL